jgi:hypothetical protein
LWWPHPKVRDVATRTRGRELDSVGRRAEPSGRFVSTIDAGHEPRVDQDLQCPRNGVLVQSNPLAKLACCRPHFVISTDGLSGQGFERDPS